MKTVEFKCQFSGETLGVLRNVEYVAESVCPSHIFVKFEDREEMHPVAPEIILVIKEQKEDQGEP